MDILQKNMESIYDHYLKKVNSKLMNREYMKNKKKNYFFDLKCLNFMVYMTDSNAIKMMKNI